ncbi:hypothetical protein Ssi03_40610 [Sphaerisporangium siamense]|uniref:Uncharacterized protein n=1 Tax=Sphaerisporangium siamense TaxID=795645 RepID=A0A7W7DCV8_9ACTN|nr:hypothetical protein [Sphaerisporangium siamense]MBB4704462.1 hypothetical protein [Sphaerisporangium siamense]GII86071.1 hypothetical protein Ssi03_40610 [Sphaerisporangium siamense]
MGHDPQGNRPSERRMSAGVRVPARAGDAGSRPPGRSPGPAARVALTAAAIGTFWLLALLPVLLLTR